MGIVFDIQRFCVNDGPGIRTNVFLKGCPLNCLWCHNPESNSRKKQLYCNWNKCVDCGKCVNVCQNHVHKMEDDKHVINFENCKLCGECIEQCPQEALGIYGKDLSVEDVILEIRKDQDYYKTSGGGVTISGGEPMFQAEYARLLAKECKNQGFHVCMETSGFAAWEKYEKIMPYIDMFLFDYKATGDALHKKLTGVSQSIILQNMKLLIQNGKNVRLRCPIIPGYNLSKEHLEAIARISTKGVSSVDIIPYHDMGKGKAKNIGSDMFVEGVKVPEQTDVEEWIEYIEKQGGIHIHQG